MSGHAAFLVLERANQLMKEIGLSFDAALAKGKQEAGHRSTRLPIV
ncbi:hypothetical protein [Spirosoma flavum]|uniref:Uncharacterized protein n=1 Tax=Spirosoma flavum TaxID=2048557 RepID=A0ABW6AI66_9BACT